MELHKYLIDTPQCVYSVALVSVAQHKSTKTTACSSAQVFACWAAAREVSVGLFDLFATVRATWTACTARTIDACKAAAAKIPTLKTC